jgi:hypothetical protein
VASSTAPGADQEGRTAASPSSSHPSHQMNESHQQQPEPMSTAINHPRNGDFSEHSETSEAHLAPEIETGFAKVPDVVKDPAAEEPEFSSDDLRELMQELDDFEADDVKETLVEAFDALSEWFGSDHWKLSERQSRMMGKPVARLLNSIWKELCRVLPEVFARWAERLPGLSGTVFVGVMVVGPKAVKQWRISRAPAPLKKPASSPARSEPHPPSGSVPHSVTSKTIIPPAVGV